LSHVLNILTSSYHSHAQRHCETFHIEPKDPACQVGNQGQLGATGGKRLVPQAACHLRCE